LTVDAGAVQLHQLTLRRHELIERLHAVSVSTHEIICKPDFSLLL